LSGKLITIFVVIPDLIGNPCKNNRLWIPAFAGMTLRIEFYNCPQEGTYIERKEIMKKLICLLIVFLFSIQFSLAQKIDVYERPFRYERSNDYDVLHYRLKLTFDLDNKTFGGENTVILTPFKDGFNKCVLDAEEFTVTEVINHRYIPLKFEQTEKHLTVYLARHYNYHDTVSFTVKYHGEGSTRGLFFSDESPRNPQMVSTDSWPNDARTWFPCYDYPHDKVTAEVIITADSKNKILSNGRLVSVTEDKKNNTKTYYWYQEQPHSTYLFMLAIGPFAVIEDSFGSVPINYWVYENDVEDAKWIFAKTPYMMDFFNKLYGYEYPWAKYDQVQTPTQGGGAEATSATILGEVVHDRKAEQDYSWEGIIAHELAHQWWGDLITLRSWDHTWLNEGFGTYSDHLYKRYAWGEDEGAVDLLNKKNGYLREAHNRYMRPIVFNRYTRPHDNFDSHTYPKAAIVLHMLRFILGDEPFFRTLQHFLHKHEFQPVDTQDFMLAVKEVTGQNMDWFFEQWLYKPGHPFFEISYTYDDNAKKVKLKVIQTQDKWERVPIYKTPVIIGITTPDGKFSKKVWLKEKTEEFEFSVEQKPLMVRFDEGNFLLKEWTFNKSVEELLYQLKNDDVTGRMWAASELIKHGDDYNAINALIDCAYNEPFWAVRRDAVGALARLGREKDMEFFKAKCIDENSKVRAVCIRALGDLKKPELVDFFKECFEKDGSYLVQSEALRSLGKCGDKSLIPFLEEAAKMKSPRRVFRRAADWAIKEINK